MNPTPITDSTPAAPQPAPQGPDRWATAACPCGDPTCRSRIIPHLSYANRFERDTAERLAAAHNALLGIPTEALKTAEIGQILWVAIELIADFKTRTETSPRKDLGDDRRIAVARDLIDAMRPLVNDIAKAEGER